MVLINKTHESKVIYFRIEKWLMFVILNNLFCEFEQFDFLFLRFAGKTVVEL